MNLLSVVRGAPRYSPKRGEMFSPKDSRIQSEQFNVLLRTRS